MKDFGYKKPVIESDHYMLGAAQSLPKDVIALDGQWDAGLPKDEYQNLNNMETYNCTGFGTNNCIETLLRYVYGGDYDFSDRFLGTVAGTGAGGNDPHKVAEAERKNGGIPESMLPFSQDILTVPDYFSFKNSDETMCRKTGQDFLALYSVGHEWVFTEGTALLQRVSMMKEALRYSPLGASVSAWQQDSDGFYVSTDMHNNHWVCIYGYTETAYGTAWKVFDSYDQSHKLLHPEHQIDFCKRYRISKNAVIPKKNWLVNIIGYILSLFKR